MKKILIHLFDVAQCGGVRVLFIVGNLLKERGYDVAYLVASGNRNLPFPSNCDFIYPPRPLSGLYRRIKWLSEQNHSSDVAIATFHPTAYSVYFNGYKAKKKIYYIQAYEPEFYTDRIIRFIRYFHLYLMAGFSYKLPLIKVVNCEGSKKGLTASEAARTPVIPPGIDTNTFFFRPKNNSILTIGHISRGEAWKGSREFFKAMRSLREKGYNFKVKVAYDLYRNANGLEYEAVFPKDDKELAEYYSSLDVCISSVWMKGFGYPPLETMACGTLCVATPMDFGMPWHDHIPIKAKSPEGIVEALEYVMKNLQSTDEIRANGLKTAEKYYWSTVIDQWVNVIEEA